MISKWVAVALAPLLLCVGCQVPASAPVSGGSVEIHYSPEENLERIDAELIATARHSIDMPMYALTDRYLAAAVAERARGGVEVRIYRDRGQWQDEEDRESGRAENGGSRRARGRREMRRRGDAEEVPQESALDLLRGNPHIHIRVKGSETLQHLKAYCIDGAVVRDGSANWSPSGEKRQDNSLVIVRSPATAARFERMFEEIWNRPDNTSLQ
jgi:phosphatidylserine/phosphatidylglycerophosphate/cardiolipin synthase-like enzyme